MKEYPMKRPMIALAGLSVAALMQVPAFAQVPPPPPTTPATIPFTKACDDVTLSVYFSAYETMLSSYSMRAVNAASDQLAGCAVTEIKTEVVSEEAHSDEDLTNISQARAAAVLDAFNARGIRASDVRTDITPVIVATVPVAQKATLARRVDVVLTAEPAYGL
tara:strand:- start:433 stop:921 length:489 start_codon:yes stop_codon:yes gene_type:complete